MSESHKRAWPALRGDPRIQTLCGSADGPAAGVLLTASANLLAGIRFIGDMMQSPAEELEYRFEAKLDLQGLYPSIRVSERGTFSLNPSPR